MREKVDSMVVPFVQIRKLVEEISRDVYKTQVFHNSKLRNQILEVIRSDSENRKLWPLSFHVNEYSQMFSKPLVFREKVKDYFRFLRNYVNVAEYRQQHDVFKRNLHSAALAFARWSTALLEDIILRAA